MLYFFKLEFKHLRFVPREKLILSEKAYSYFVLARGALLHPNPWPLVYIQGLSNMSQKMCQISEDVNVYLLNPKSNSAKGQSSGRDVQYFVSIFEK